MSVFELSKWYADCVDEQGEAAILYHAVLRAGILPIHYQSLLLKKPGSPAHAQYSLGRNPAPAVGDGCIEWHSRKWKTHGCWNDLGPAHHQVLFASEEGVLEWSCVAPRATASVQLGPNRSLRGWGYVEHLRLTVSPWRLPIRRLRWGRFVNAANSLVWIDWSGPYNKRVTYLNGSSVSAEGITDHEIVLANETGVLHLESSEVIRDGQLGLTALAVIPKLDRLFPDSVLKMRERKWISRAIFRRPGCPDSIGMAIHEVVEWP